MRVAALYDIHGNLPALEAVLDELLGSDVDELVIGGDVFPGPMAGECLDRLSAIDTPLRFIRGNGDRAVLALAAGREASGVPEQALPALRWSALQLRDEQRDTLSRWPGSLSRRVEGIGDVLFCHATPGSDTEIFTRLTPEERLRGLFAGVEAPLVVCGHTHMQFDRRVGELRVVNAGSVGMPFGEPVACWLLLGPGVELRQTSYDLRQAAARVRATGYPQAEQFAAGNVLQPPRERDMLELFGDAPSGAGSAGAGDA